MYELGGAKQAGSTYAHGGPAGKRGRSLRAGRKNTHFPLSYQPETRAFGIDNRPPLFLSPSGVKKLMKI